MLTSIRPFRLVLACSAPLLLMATSVADDLAARVTAQIQAAPALKGNPITVKALGPTVWLSGTASSAQQQAALAIAKQTPGVERVVDQLSVSRPVADSAATAASMQQLFSPQSMAPAVAMRPQAAPASVQQRALGQRGSSPAPAQPELATAVATALRNSGSLKGYRVSVKAQNGTVWLTGTLSSLDQLQAAVALAERTPGVERVVNRLSVAEAAVAAEESSGLFSLPESMRSLIGLTPKAATPVRQDAAVQQATGTMRDGGVELANGQIPDGDSMGLIQLTQAQQEAVGQAQYPGQSAGQRRAMAARGRQPMTRSGGTPVGRPLPMRMAARPPRGGVRPAGYGEPMVLPGSQDYADYGVDGLVDGQMVPGSMQISEGGMGMPQGGMPMGAMGGGPGMGRPMPMGGSGVGMPAVPVRGGGPNMPNYAWPSYAANPNYAALQYPTQYSPTAWPYIGPFYPYPQVPLGWRRVSLEWDDGWWFLDFDERHVHSHHR
jgi:osmotically-inducible protein OsmY